jgi:hypothetical protein
MGACSGRLDFLQYEMPTFKQVCVDDTDTMYANSLFHITFASSSVGLPPRFRCHRSGTADPLFITDRTVDCFHHRSSISRGFGRLKSYGDKEQYLPQLTQGPPVCTVSNFV